VRIQAIHEKTIFSCWQMTSIWQSWPSIKQQIPAHWCHSRGS
jgi:hypothetical protein